MNENLCEITMDIAGAYPEEAGLAYYRRTATLCKGHRILIKDCYAFQPDKTGSKNTVVISLMTYEKPTPQTIAQDLLLHIGNLGTVTIRQAQLAAIEEIPITDPRLQTAWTHNLYRILIKPDCPESELSIE